MSGRPSRSAVTSRPGGGRTPRPRPAPRAAPPRSAILASAIVFTLLAWALVAVALWPVYRAAPYVLLAVIAIAAGTAIAAAGALLRWPAWGGILASVAVLTIVGVPLAVPERTVYGILPEPAGLLELASGIVLGWRQLLTIDLPVGSYQALLVPALVLLYVGPLLTASIALRTRRPALATAVPALGFVLAIALGRDDRPLPLSIAAGLGVVLMLWIAVLRRHRRTESLRAGGAANPVDARGAVARAFASATVLLLIAVGAGVAAADALAPPADRVVLRSIVERPFDPRDLPSPLAAYRSAFSLDRASTIALRVSGAPAGSRLRVATLDSYDGVVFAVGSSEVAAASGRFVRIPTEREVETPGERATIRIELLESTGSWLPTVGEFRGVRFAGDDSADLRDRVRLNATTGTAVLIGGAAPETVYELDAVVEEEPSIRLADSAPGATAVPGIAAVSEDVRTWLDGVTAGVDGAGARLQAALDAIREQGYISHGVDPDEPASRSGHSLDRIGELVTRRPMVGDAEQYAVLAALVARELGFPSRVVLGYGPLDGEEASLRSDQLTAWIEVDVAGEGWVPIDVMPPEREIPPAEPQEPVPVSRPQNAVQPPAEVPPVADEQAPPEIEPGERPDEDPLLALLPAIARIGGIVLLAMALIAAPFVGVVAAKAGRRRRRRRAADPTLRILGGWRELTDAAADHGLDMPVGATRREVAGIIGQPQAGVLARVADRVDYAPEPPQPGEADRVWTAVDAVRAGLDAGRRRRDRWRAALSVRSLRRYPGRSSTEPGRRAP
ncbi:hypothetical protein ASC54_09660 [Yonghaparkia sp. Root332]|nr:hypothetical protein ASC54_09660 [Yonghaparkia sp. Root332]